MRPRCATAKSRLVGSPTTAASMGPARSTACRHGGVAGFLAVTQDDQQATAPDRLAGGQVTRGAQHRGNRRLGVSRAAAVKQVALDGGDERRPGPALARRDRIKMGDQREGGPGLRARDC